MTSKLAINGGNAIYPPGLKRGKVFGEEERQTVWEVMGKGIVSRAGRGDYVRSFEDAFAKYHNVPFAITTTSGTTALHTAVQALNLKSGDEVIVPDLTFISTASVVLQAGANVVLCDVDRDTLNISVEDLKRKITGKTKAVIAVHLYGAPADMENILAITREYGLYLIEDCAQAHGAHIGGNLIGTLGDMGCFSFYQTKNMSCGEGGMVITSNETLAKICRSLTRHGLAGDDLSEYDYDKVGFNYAMTELQAAIGLVQLKKLEALNHARSQNAHLYRSKLENLGLRFQKDHDGHVYHCLTAVLPEEMAPQRNLFLAAVRAEGALINCLYPLSLSKTKIFTDSSSKPPISDQVASSLFNLYTNPDIDEHFISICCEAIEKVISSLKGG